MDERIALMPCPQAPLANSDQPGPSTYSYKIRGRQDEREMINSISVNGAGESHMDGNHVASLITKHAQLDQKIRQETGRPQPDQSRLNRWKKEKLRIKEELVLI